MRSLISALPRRSLLSFQQGLKSSYYCSSSRYAVLHEPGSLMTGFPRTRSCILSCDRAFSSKTPTIETLRGDPTLSDEADDLRRMHTGDVEESNEGEVDFFAGDTEMYMRESEIAFLKYARLSREKILAPVVIRHSSFVSDEEMLKIEQFKADAIQRTGGSLPLMAVISVGGFQYRVVRGDRIAVQHLEGLNIGDQIVLEKVLLLADAETTAIGRPIVPFARVVATLEEHELADKVVIFKKKRRKNYRRTLGHRQELSVLHIDSIGLVDNHSLADIPESKKD